MPVSRVSEPSCARLGGEWGGLGAGMHLSPGSALLVGGVGVSTRGAKLAARAAASDCVAVFSAAEGPRHDSGVSSLPAALALRPTDGPPAMAAAASRLVDAWAALKPRVHAALSHGWDGDSSSDAEVLPRAQVCSAC